MTKPAHKNQVGQDGTGVNGGEFAKKTQTDDNVALPGAGLTDEWYQYLQRASDTAARVEQEARRNRIRLETEIVREHIRREVPAGVTAVFANEWGGGYRLTAVTDEDGANVWADDNVGFAQHTEQLLEYIGTDANAYFDEEDQDLTLRLNLTAPKHARHIPVDELIGVNTLNDSQTEDLLIRFADTRGEILTYANKAAVADLLRQWEAEEDIHMDLRHQLIMRFGTEDAAVDAIVTSPEWKRFAGAVDQYAHSKLESTIRDAATSL